MVDKRTGVDVDVEEPRTDRFPDEVLDGLDLGLRVGRVLLQADLEVVPLNEHGTCPAGRDRGREDGRRVLPRRLGGIPNLRPGDLEDQGAGIALDSLAECRFSQIKRERTEVDGRHRERVRHLAPCHRLVEVVNGRWVDAELQGKVTDEPLCPCLLDCRAEVGQPCDGADVPAQVVPVADLHLPVLRVVRTDRQTEWRYGSSCG